MNSFSFPLLKIFVNYTIFVFYINSKFHFHGERNEHLSLPNPRHQLRSAACPVRAERFERCVLLHREPVRRELRSRHRARAVQRSAALLRHCALAARTGLRDAPRGAHLLRLHRPAAAVVPDRADAVRRRYRLPHELLLSVRVMRWQRTRLLPAVEEDELAAARRVDESERCEHVPVHRIQRGSEGVQADLQPGQVHFPDRFAARAGRLLHVQDGTAAQGAVLHAGLEDVR